MPNFLTLKALDTDNDCRAGGMAAGATPLTIRVLACGGKSRSQGAGVSHLSPHHHGAPNPRLRLGVLEALLVGARVTWSCRAGAIQTR